MQQTCRDNFKHLDIHLIRRGLSVYQKLKVILLLNVIFVFASLFCLTSVHAASWYVDNSASGSNNGTSWANAWQSFSSVNFGSMSSGDTLYISGGSSSKTYTGTLNVPAGTTNITITKGADSGHNGEVIFDGELTTAYGISINATGTAIQNLTISSLSFDSYTGAGIYGNGQTSGGLQNLLIDNCRFTTIRRSGVFLEGNSNLANNHDIIVSNSYFDDDDSYNEQSDGIYAQVLTDFTADGNYIVLDNNYLGVSDLHSDNIQTFWVDNVTYSNNTIVQIGDKTLGTQMLFSENGYGVHKYINNLLIRNSPYAEDSAIRVKSTAGLIFTAVVAGNSYYGKGRIMNSSVVATIKNNIFYGISQPNSTRAIYLTASGSDVSNNIFYDPNSQFPAISGGTDVDPLFVNASFTSTDMHLSDGSPAIDTGADLGASYNTDFDGAARGATWDIGAYEYYSPLTVTINQKSDQSDPATTSPINFTVVFSESVTGFATGDVSLAGTAGATTATVTGSGTTYNVAVSGMTGTGTVIASIGSGKATGTSGNSNSASTSTDNTVTYNASVGPTLSSITIYDVSGYINDSTPIITISASDSPSHVAFSCNGGTNWSEWIAYSSTITSFNITNGATGCSTSNGSKTITAKLKNILNDESSTTSDTTYFDDTQPTGGSVTYTDTYYTSASVSITANDGTDNASGIDNSTRTLQRRSATLTNDTCGSYGSFSTISPSGTYPNYTDSSVSTGYCYQYRYIVSDSASNQSTNTSSNTAKVDTAGPVISSVTAVNLSSTGATVTWSTNEGSSTQINYGLTNSYGLSTTEADTTDRTTVHSTNISSLTACTKYHYRARSKDYALTETVGNDNTFITSGCLGDASVVASTDSQIETSTGGTVSLSSNDEGVSISIPVSFHSIDANFQIKQLTKANVIGVTGSPNGYDQVGDYLYDLSALSDISTKVSTFDQPIEVVYSYDPNDLGSYEESYLKVFRYDSGTWSELSNCVVDTVSNTATCNTSNFSVFGIFGIEPTPETPITQSPQSTQVSNSASSICTDIYAGNKPDLFEIITNGNSATLYFSPPFGQYSLFYIEYSSRADIWEHGLKIDQGYSNGALKHTVSGLKPNTTYYFRIRAGNGCAAGEWDKKMLAKTTSSSKITKRFYKNMVATMIKNVRKNTTTAALETNKIIETQPENALISPVTTTKPVPTYIPYDKPLPTYLPTQTTTDTTIKPKRQFCIFKWCFSY